MGGGQALRQRLQAARVFQRIAGRHQPPHPVELEPLHGQQAGGEMRSMRRIEGATEQADSQARRMGRQREAGRLHRGHSGTPRSSEPGIQTRMPGKLLDSGFAPSARPGMTSGDITA